MRTIDSKAELLSLLDEAVRNLAILNIKVRNDSALYSGTIQFVHDGSLEQISVELTASTFKTIRIKEIESIESDIPLLENGDKIYLVRTRFTAL